jgi:flagellar hook-basal body complex protein FliE
MDKVDINQVMTQMRATAARLEANRPTGVTEPGATAATQGSFQSMLSQAVTAVSDTQKSAAAGAAAVEAGDPNVPLTDVMLQLQKADLSFRAMTEVRNRLVSAYQEIMNMPV